VSLFRVPARGTREAPAPSAPSLKRRTIFRGALKEPREEGAAGPGSSRRKGDERVVIEATDPAPRVFCLTGGRGAGQSRD
jgi:hypothetical protein